MVRYGTMPNSQESKCGIAFTMWDLQYFLSVTVKFCLMRECWHLLFCVPMGRWLGFFCVFLMATKTFISFSPSSATWWYPLQDTFPVCSHAVFENQWLSALSLIFPSLPLQGLSYFPSRAFFPAQASIKLAARSRSFFVCGVPPPLHPLLHPRSTSPKLRTTVPPKILLSGLLPSHSFVCPWVHRAGIATGRVGCN